MLESRKACGMRQRSKMQSICRPGPPPSNLCVGETLPPQLKEGSSLVSPRAGRDSLSRIQASSKRPKMQMQVTANAMKEDGRSLQIQGPSHRKVTPRLRPGGPRALAVPHRGLQPKPQILIFSSALGSCPPEAQAWG